MKFSPTSYAKALLEAVQEHPEKEAEFRKRFMEVVGKHGDVVGFPKIIRELARLRDESEKVHRVSVESARPIGEKTMKELEAAFGKGYIFEAIVVPELVAGVRITIDGENVIDASLAGKVKKLFQ